MDAHPLSDICVFSCIAGLRCIGNEFGGTVAARGPRSPCVPAPFAGKNDLPSSKGPDALVELSADLHCWGHSRAPRAALWVSAVTTGASPGGVSPLLHSPSQDGFESSPQGSGELRGLFGRVKMRAGAPRGTRREQAVLEARGGRRARPRPHRGAAPRVRAHLPPVLAVASASFQSPGGRGGGVPLEIRPRPGPPPSGTEEEAPFLS